MNTAVTGLNVQSKALGNISDNVANVQTTGYKRVDTSFVSLITQATPANHEPGGVLSRPLYMNNVQGTIQSTGTTTNLAIAGEGMFAVSQKTGVSSTSGTPTFAADPLYTRAGDFALDSQGYLVNGSGYYLNGWVVDPASGMVTKNASQPIQVTQLKDNPQETTSISLSANLPTQPDTNLDINTGTAPVDMPAQPVTIYDAQGTPHVVELNWTWTQGNPAAIPPTTDTWTLGLTTPDATMTVAPTLPLPSSVPLTFYTANNALTGAQAGSIAAIDGTTGTIGTDAGITFDVSYANGNTQKITLGFGRFGVAQQLTNFTGTDIDLNSATQDGLPPGSFRNLAISDDGMVTLNYDNGNKKTVFQIPIAQFQNYNGLQSEAGNAYSATSES